VQPPAVHCQAIGAARTRPSTTRIVGRGPAATRTDLSFHRRRSRSNGIRRGESEELVEAAGAYSVRKTKHPGDQGHITDISQRRGCRPGHAGMLFGSESANRGSTSSSDSPAIRGPGCEPVEGSVRVCGWPRRHGSAGPGPGRRRISMAQLDGGRNCQVAPSPVLVRGHHGGREGDRRRTPRASHRSAAGPLPTALHHDPFYVYADDPAAVTVALGTGWPARASRNGNPTRACGCPAQNAVTVDGERTAPLIEVRNSIVAVDAIVLPPPPVDRRGSGPSPRGWLDLNRRRR